MVTEFFINLGVMIGEWFVGLAPASVAPVPAEVESFDTTVNGFIGNFGGLGVWVPWPLVIFCAVTAVAIWAIAWGVKAVAFLWGQVPVIGGSG